MSSPPYRPAPDISWARVDRMEPSGTSMPVVYLAHLPDGPVMILEGPGALTWAEAISDEQDSVVDRVAAHYRLDGTELRDDVEGYLRGLVARGLLTEARAQ